MSDNGHKKSKEEEQIELTEEMEKRRERCEAKLKEFTEWLETLEECQMEVIREDVGEVAAYFMSRSPCKLTIILQPELLLDIVSLMVYALWQGMNIEEARQEGKADGKT